MENASRALIMAASVLLGVMILTVAVALFRSFGNSGAQIIEEIEKNQIIEFNSQFLKYANQDELTAHDVVSIANLAHKTNLEEEVDKGNILYIQVLANNFLPSNKNIEKCSEDELKKLLKQQINEYVKVDKEDGSGDFDYKPKYYYKLINIEVNNTSGKINLIELKQFSR